MHEYHQIDLLAHIDRGSYNRYTARSKPRLSALPYTAWRPHTPHITETVSTIIHGLEAAHPHITVRSPYNEGVKTHLSQEKLTSFF
ncbi:12457_t:CDS:2 [Funneliformis caledonium]|uniref:12457_t:CDS:1 n=1 Tax=Funneliformis caledonium TaxID=1117310 RepID=A0A9N9G125_9GLOM|nr:12457_t:CDS:2 [Funneliformis caledonium]